MRFVFFLIASFVLGLFSFVWFPFDLLPGNAISLLLYMQLFLVGASLVGTFANGQSWRDEFHWSWLCYPILITGGAYLAGLLFSLVFDYPLFDILAVMSGLGYYSITSTLIAEVRGEELAVLGLFTNMFRELMSIFLAPLLIRLFGKMAPIASAASTSSDTVLPIILRFSGKEYALLAVFNGIVLTIAVPFLVVAFL